MQGASPRCFCANLIALTGTSTVRRFHPSVAHLPRHQSCDTPSRDVVSPRRSHCSPGRVAPTETLHEGDS